MSKSPLTPALERARALIASGDLEPARVLLERAVELGRENLGEDEPDVLTAQRELAGVFLLSDDPMGARRMLEDAYAAGQWKLGDSDPVMLHVSHDLGVVAEELGNKHEARKAFGRVAANGPAVLGDGHQFVARARAYLGEDLPAATVGPSVSSAGPDKVPPATGPWHESQAGADPGVEIGRPGMLPATAPTAGVVLPPESSDQVQPSGTVWPPARPQPDVAGVSMPPGWQGAPRAGGEGAPGGAGQETPGSGWAGAPGGAREVVPSPYPRSTHDPASREVPGPAWQALPGQPVVLTHPATADSGALAHPYRGRGRGLAVGLTVTATLVALSAVAALVVVLADREQLPPQPQAVVSAGPVLAGEPPSAVRLDDRGDAVELTWRDPAEGRAPFVVTMARAGQQLKPVSNVGLGKTEALVEGLNKKLEYCFAVVAVYGTDRFASSGQVCTERS